MKSPALFVLVAATLAACDTRTPIAPAAVARPEFSAITENSNRPITIAAVATGTLDQSQTASDGAAFFGFSIQQAQTFTAGITGRLGQVDVDLSRVGSPGDIAVQIRTVSAGAPSSTIIASATISQSSVSEASFNWISVALGPSVAVTSGTQYAIVLSAPAAPVCCDGYEWAASFQNPYPGGTLEQLVGTGGTWVSLTAVDLAFKTYVTSLPTSKDQCKNGGWMTFPQFKNEGDCVSFVSHQKT